MSGDPTKSLGQATPLDANYTKNHVVLLTNLDPGAIIYSFQVESIDLAGNVARTKTYTVLTPQQDEGIIQIILQQMQDTFGWLNNLKG